MAKRKKASAAPAEIKLPFSRPSMVATLPKSRATEFDISPDTAETAAIIAFMGIADLSTMRFKGQITADGADGWTIKARLTASATQNCVVSLEPVAQTIDETIERNFVPAAQQTVVNEVDLDVDGDDDPDSFVDVLDPGHLALEVLSLALDPYPRAKDANLSETGFTAPGIKPLTDEDVKPFAGLAALKDSLEKK